LARTFKVKAQQEERTSSKTLTLAERLGPQTNSDLLDSITEATATHEPCSLSSPRPSGLIPPEQNQAPQIANSYPIVSCAWIAAHPTFNTFLSSSKTKKQQQSSP
ncbi:hypothetical protein PTTG_29807, partial [Puccinia triticina 1-1 BBBD Race 1]